MDPSHILSAPKVEITEKLTYVEEPIEIIGREVRKLRSKEIPMVKVKWSYHKTFGETTWEVKEHMRRKYPQLFENSGKLNFEDEIS